MKVIDTYILACVLALVVTGHGHAQNTRQNRRQKMENVAPDTIRPQTMTHTMPFQPVYTLNIPKDKFIKFSNLDESVHLNLQGFVNMKKNGLTFVAAPFGVLSPFARFGNTVDLGITTTNMVWNYFTPKTFSPVVHDLYAYGKVHLKGCDVTVFAGKKSLLNYAGEVAKYMPLKDFLMNAACFKSGHYYQRVVGAGFVNKLGALQVGYAEEGPEGFGFNGNGAIVFASEAFLDNWKGGILVTIGQEKTIIDMQMIYRPNTQHLLMAEITNTDIQNSAGIHIFYNYTCEGGKVAFFLNGYKQLGNIDNPVQGFSCGATFPKLHTTLVFGGAENDPMYKTNPDGTPNENNSNFVMFLGAEFRYGIMLRGSK